MFTQPLMYKRIKKHPDVLKVYADKLIREGRVTKVTPSLCKDEWMVTLSNRCSLAL